jgi:putative membrane protein
MAGDLVLSAAERDAVTAAVAAAEAGSDGEIVTVVSDSSDAYHDVALHYAVAAVLAVTAVAAMWPGLLASDGGWGGGDRGRELLLLLIAQAVAFLLVRFALAWRPLRLLLTPRATLSRRVRRRAVQYFRLAAENRTEGREAVLLYLSVAEHRAELIADAAVHKAVAPEAWGAAMAALVDAVRAGRPGDGMVAAVGAIGTILSEHFPKTAANPNEIPDRVIEL